MKDTISILRLTSGDDIITTLVDDNKERVKLDNPLSMIYRTVDNGTMMVLVPWLPLEFIESNTVYIDRSRIILTMEPSIRMVNAYAKALIALYDSSSNPHDETLSFLSKVQSSTVH